MKLKQQRRVLKLNKETIRRLSDVQLSKIYAGDEPLTGGEPSETTLGIGCFPCG